MRIYTDIINVCFPQRLFSAIIKNLIVKSHRLFVEVTSAMLTSGMAYKNMSSLQHSTGGPTSSRDVHMVFSGVFILKRGFVF